MLIAFYVTTTIGHHDETFCVIFRVSVREKRKPNLIFSKISETREELEYIIVEAWNITQKHVAETELAKKIDEMQNLTSRVKEIDALRSKFLANISHELKTPLALILAALDKMKSIHESENRSENSLSTSSEDDAKSLEVIKLNSFTLLKARILSRV